MRKIFLLFIALSVASCSSTKKTTSVTPDKFVLENLIGFNSEEIKEYYPDANVYEAIGVFEEGTEELPYSILYPDTPNELHITWSDASRAQIYDIRISIGGDWRSSTGIKIGTTYDELNKLNGKPISFYGFGWDYSGAVVWNEGKFEKSKLRIFLSPEKEPKVKFYGDHIIEASPEEIAELNLRIQTIVYKL
ncbi:MAG TPA: hypothetical protein VFD29_00865 [Gillisia sp.]|nr:hypothetical protein [Gillisia sp.]